MRLMAASLISIGFLLVGATGAQSTQEANRPSKSKIDCAKAKEAATDIGFQYQKLLFLNSASAWATTARDPLGGTLDGIKLQANAKTLKFLKSVKTTQLGFSTVKKSLANISQLGKLVDAALASSTPYPGPGEEAYNLATKNALGDRAVISYALEKRGC